MIVVLDASTLVSAALKEDSVPERAVLRAIASPNRVILSQAVEDEYREVLFRAKFDRFVSRQHRARVLDLVIAAADRSEPSIIVRACRDSHDDKYLAFAVAGGGAVLVSSDYDLLAMNPWREVAILSPREFLSIG